ncbi:MAG TPA: YciI family protein [Caulobacterales bacterium]|nr:YciI family protein [Caulobacterales bacterium]
MRYLCLVKSAENKFGPPPQALYAAMDELMAEAMKAGVMEGGGGLLPTADGFRARAKNRKSAITDGPFSEAKEVVGGYAFFNVKTKEDMLYWTQRFIDLHIKLWPEWEGESEVRQIIDGSSPPQV